MVTMAQSTMNWRNTHTYMDHTHSLTLTSTQPQPRCAKRQLSYYRIWNQFFILKIPEGGGANRSTQRTPPPDSLPANQYHILEEKIQSPGQELNPHPPTFVISLPGQERAAPDPLSYRPHPYRQ